MNFSALEQIKTQNQFEDALSYFKDYEVTLSKINVTNNTPLFYMEILNKLFEQNNANTPEEKRKIIIESMEYLKKLQKITLEIPFNASEKFAEKIYIIFQNIIKKHYLLNIIVNHQLTVGAKIQFNGQIYKYTLSNML